MRMALCLGNRGFFPESLIAAAKSEVTAALQSAGIESFASPVALTQFGAVGNGIEGRRYAEWLAGRKGEYDGVLLVLANFGDENGAAEALRDCGTPIYVLAYPDEIGNMGFHSRRDAFCGKLSVMDVFRQYGIRYTAWPPHTLSPANPEFVRQMQLFAGVCRIVKGVRRARYGAVGARPTAFKTIRFDEMALQQAGITTEAFDNSDLLLRVQKLADDSPEVREKIRVFETYADFSRVPEDRMRTLAKTSVALDNLIQEYALDGIAFRCWSDLQETLRISACAILGELNNRGIPAACETDVCNTLAMHALTLASGEPPACLDWNNNYGNDPDKCILFHCGSIPEKLMTGKGAVTDHSMFRKSLGPGCAFGCCEGRIRPMEFSFASTMTDAGKIRYYAGEGKITDDVIEPAFFGCGGVAEIDGLQKKIHVLGKAGYRHHVSLTPGRWTGALREAFSNYLGFEETEF